MTTCEVHTVAGPDEDATTANGTCEVCERRRVFAEMDRAGKTLYPLQRAELMIEQLRESLARGGDA